MDIERAASEEPAPSELNTIQTGHSVEISKEKLVARYTGEGRHNNDVGGVQANRPVPSKRLVYYYEVTVLDQGESSTIAVGFAEKNFKLTRQPGYAA